MAKFISLNQFFKCSSDAKTNPVYINVDNIVTMHPESFIDGVPYTLIYTLMPMAEGIMVKETIEQILERI